MAGVAIFPNKYVQGRNTLGQIAGFVEPIAKSALLLVDKQVRPFVEPPVRESFENKGHTIDVTDFGGECTWDEINRVSDLVRLSGTGIIIGAGGGKTLDTAKGAADKSGSKVAVLPTTAATDAPTSALSVVYTPEGEFQEYYLLPRNPDLVLVDTQIVANAPVRFLISGIGDALATWFEADATYRSGGSTMAGGTPTAAALALARLCFDTLMEFGPSAILAARQKAVTPALERVVEANTLLSGLGFESGGLAAAHSIHNGLTELRETHSYLHGEKVAFGTLVQLILENRPTEEIEEVMGFMATVGLPACFEGIGLKNPSRETLRKAAEAATKEGETIHNEPVPITADDVLDALLAADAYGRSFPGACSHE